MIYGTEDHAQRYRCLHLRQQLDLYGMPSCALRFDEVSPSAVRRHKAVILHRVPFDKHIDKLILQARRQGNLSLFDTDDLVFEGSACDVMCPPLAENTVRAALHRDETARYCRMMELADAVLVSTGFLARQATRFGKRAHVHRNAFSLEMLALSERAYEQCEVSDQRLVIGYASGTPTHDRDFQEAKPALRHTLSKYPHTELWLIGHVDPGPDWGVASDRIKQLAFVPWQRLPGLLARFDINIAPLEANNPFCQAKSEVKYIEAGLVRVPTVASRTDAFEYAIRSAENGLLVDGHQDWVGALERLVEDAPFRREMGERAYADVLRRYHPLVRGRELLATLDLITREVHGRALWPGRSAGGVAEATAFECASPAACGSRPSVGRKALYALRYRGLRTFLMQGWVYVRRCLAQQRSYREPGGQER
jgi:glycosyltransferase involved in cell wall biosynthesis